MIFFGGLSIHISKALLAHMFSYNIREFSFDSRSFPRPTLLAEWGATKKEVERSNFFLEVPKILLRFRVALILTFLTVAGMVVLTLPFIPSEWVIPSYQWSRALESNTHMETSLTLPPVILPLATVLASHVLYPVSVRFAICGLFVRPDDALMCSWPQIALNPWLMKL
jgi:hypothetical protein